MADVALLALGRGYASLYDLPIAAYVTDADGYIASFNDRAVELWGRQPLQGERWCGSHKIFHLNGNPMPHVDCPMARSILSGSAVRDTQALLQTPSGAVKAFRPHPVLFRDDRAKVTGAINLLLDVTEGWQALGALSESEAWLSGVFNSDVVGLTVFDFHNLKTIKANDYILTLIGASRAEYETGERTCVDATPEEFQYLDEQALLQAKVSGFWEPFEKEYQRPDGSRVPVRVSSAPMSSFAGHCVVCVEDLTNQRAAEQRLRTLQAEVHHLSRLSAMGTMASILAHEVAQPLSAISNALSAAERLTARSDDEAWSKMLHAVRIARDQSARANAIVRRIKNFSAPDHIQHQCFDLERLIEEAASLALLKCPEVDLRVFVTPKARFAFGDPVQIEQVLVNLLRNSADALERRGEVAVEARLRSGKIIVSVIDSGPGFEGEAKNRPFDPFVTTKADGTGLGLSVCRSIIEQHGGSIAIAPTENGARLQFTLERASDPRGSLR